MSFATYLAVLSFKAAFNIIVLLYQNQKHPATKKTTNNQSGINFSCIIPGELHTIHIRLQQKAFSPH